MIVSALQKGRLLLAFLMCLSGCATVPDAVRKLPREHVQVELTSTPFYAQERYQCGPAALTTLLEASGASVSLDNMVSQVYLPGREGSLQLELIAATRTSNRLPYLIDKSLAGIVGELEDGRAVLVLQNLGTSVIPRWHYAVVVGIDTSRDIVVLRSGTERRRETPIDLFLRTWSRGDYWAFVALRPDELPANVDRQRYFSAIVGLEQTGMASAAAGAWETALRRWPDDTTALFGLGNARLQLGDYPGAQQSYEKLIRIDPQLTIAHNNLALALARQEHFDAALSQIGHALQMNANDALEPVLRETRAEIMAMAE